MTDSRWPNEYDRKIWTWPKTDNDENSLDELDQNLIFGQVQSSIFVVVVIFFIFFTFGQIQLFSVKFNKLTFVVVIFGHVLTNFWSYWFGEGN